MPDKGFFTPDFRRFLPVSAITWARGKARPQDIVGHRPPDANQSPPVKRTLRLAALLVFCVLTFAARSHNLRDVFVEGRIYFLDADCYSRMTRARMVAEHHGMVVRHHDFENFPQGVNAQSVSDAACDRKK